jgi:phosphoribosylformylglycinamidine synthase subunit PurQ / glutaminase
MQPRALILRTAGTNCDVETGHAFTLAGAEPIFLHLNRVLEKPDLLNQYQLLAIPGGFSYGDDIAAGRILANQLSHHLGDRLRRFVEAGKPIIGICNGFQVLVKTELLPGPLAGRSGQTCTLTNNDSGRFIDRWVHLSARSRRCIWTQSLGEGGPIELPVAHAEGKFVTKDDAIRHALWENEHVALVYVRPDGAAADGEPPHNPNGSIDEIAGICDASGLVFGLMPHPERHLEAIQHPAWTRRRRGNLGEGDGLRVFKDAVAHARSGVGAGV